MVQLSILAPLLLLFLLIHRRAEALVTARGFVSINCGGTADFLDPEGVYWRTDAPIKVRRADGLAANITTIPGTRQELQSLRYFPTSTSPAKSCYIVAAPPPPDTTDPRATAYLVRLGFLYANYDNLNSPPSFSVSLDRDPWALVQLESGNDPLYIETFSFLQTPTTAICFIRLKDTQAPLVNSIELRALPYAWYPDLYGTQLLHLHMRVNFGGPSLRFPVDQYDRKWSNYLDLFPNLIDVPVVQTSAFVDDGGNPHPPPEQVMTTSISSPHFSFSFSSVPSFLVNVNATYRSYPIFYFVDYSSSGQAGSEIRQFRMKCSNLFDPIVMNLSSVPPLSSLAIDVPAVIGSYVQVTPLVSQCDLYQDFQSINMLNPTVSAAELLLLQDKTFAITSSIDVSALSGLSKELNFERLWLGDPCLPAPWQALVCVAISSTNFEVTILDLSGMNLSGPIPSNISLLPALTSLNLSNNHFKGSLPNWLNNLTQLTSLDVSNNNLQGTIPPSLITKLGNNFRYTGNDGLIYKPHKTFNKLILIIATFSFLALIICIILVFLGYKVILSNSSTNGLFDKEYRELQRRLQSQGAKAQPLSLAKIKRATNNFEKKIGEGGFGPVYHGTLEDGQEVAVKVLSTKSSQGRREFCNEVELLSTVHHRNLVSLLGYCQVFGDQILVYEYMKGGDVYDRLHGKTASANTLTWSERKSIIIEVAEGLEYLHQGCNLCIIHRDVKSKNVLLSETTKAKVADFGLSRLKSIEEQEATHITTTVKGTTGYLDPEYYVTKKLTEKSDVYGFGILMMEIICGRAPVIRSLPMEQMYIADSVRTAWKAKALEDIVDPNLQGNFEDETLYNLVNLALWCVEHTSKRRPSMTEVVQELRQFGLEPSASLSWSMRNMKICSCGQFGCDNEDHHQFSSSDSESSISEVSIQLSIRQDEETSPDGEISSLQMTNPIQATIERTGSNTLLTTAIVKEDNQDSVCRETVESNLEEAKHRGGKSIWRTLGNRTSLIFHKK